MADLLETLGAVVGAAWIEHATPTMSTYRPYRKRRNIRHFLQVSWSFPASGSLYVPLFRFSELKGTTHHHPDHQKGAVDAYGSHRKKRAAEHASAVVSLFKTA